MSEEESAGFCSSSVPRGASAVTGLEVSVVNLVRGEARLSSDREGGAVVPAREVTVTIPDRGDEVVALDWGDAAPGRCATEAVFCPGGVVGTAL
ncbi:MAG: hypothetical protein HQL57_05705 [Magnetococcales bacterium]|nr:hypothetical protein [Magnetococcales bacterium]MBF0156661.1 hypothetical protein [Magnetococcales bacterium]